MYSVGPSCLSSHASHYGCGGQVDHQLRGYELYSSYEVTHDSMDGIPNRHRCAASTGIEGTYVLSLLSSQLGAHAEHVPAALKRVDRS